MTEFEATSLSLREAALWVAIVHVLVGAGKPAATCWGIRVMGGISDDLRRDAEARDRRTEEYARQARKRHEKAMAALTELIRRTDALGTARPRLSPASESRKPVAPPRTGANRDAAD